ncbi:MAG: hypothetical protein HY808_14615 [Nitrospirae bacterium]|nr:hypothetical protein [Nitrospirota bacterium]
MGNSPLERGAGVCPVLAKVLLRENPLRFTIAKAARGGIINQCRKSMTI